MIRSLAVVLACTLAVDASGAPGASAPAASAPGASRGNGAPATARAAGASGAVVRVQHRDPSALPSRGPKNAIVTVELFFTPGTGSRSQNYKAIEKLQAAHPTRIRIVYRIIKGGASTRLPYAALYSHGEGKFFELIEALNAYRTQTPSDKELVDIATKVGLDPDKLLRAIAKPPEAYEALLQGNERRQQRRIRGSASPAALFNGRLPQTAFTALGMTELEREYLAAKEYAEDLIDRGADPNALVDAFEHIPPVAPQDILVSPGMIDDEFEDAPTDEVLATPALDLRGLPSVGKLDAATTIAVLCSPISGNCGAPMRTAEAVQRLYPDAVRVVWAPFYRLDREDAAELSMLADTALCAEKLGVTLERDTALSDDPRSSGWQWVQAISVEAGRRATSPEKVIDRVAERFQVDSAALATCRAQLAGASVAWIEAARRSGVRVTPSTVVGGRIYGPIDNKSTLQLLVEAELAPGMLGDAVPAWSNPDRASR